MRSLISACPRSVLRLAIVGLLAGVAAGCSADVTRFNENPFSTPFGSRQQPDPDVTGSLPPPPEPGPRISTAPVESAPLSSPVTTAQPYPPPSYPAPVATAPVAPRPISMQRPVPVRPASPASAQWTAEGGTAVTAVAGDTTETLSRRYGVPATAIAQANGLTGPAAIGPGQRVIIPVYRVGAPAAPAAPQIAAVPAPIAKPAAVQPKAPKVATAQPEQTLKLPAAKPVKGPQPAAKPLDPKAQPKKTAELPKAAEPKKHEPAKVAKVEPAKIEPAKPAKVEKTAKVEKPIETVAKVEPVATPAPEAPPAAATTKANFRMPVKGRIVADFGNKINGTANEGINFAVPEGTPVQAAEDGVVAYAGGDLKSYGNLVLIRHSNGYVTAYAHTKDMMVKKGQVVKRGEVIAKAGQTGQVSSPQLHFEIRKGSTPVEPKQYLSGL